MLHKNVKIVKAFNFIGFLLLFDERRALRGNINKNLLFLSSYATRYISDIKVYLLICVSGVHQT